MKAKLSSFMVLSFCLTALAVQTSETFKTRLALVTMDLAMVGDVTGLGKATANLASSKLAVNGTFSGPTTKAITAAIGRSSVTEVHGPVIFDLRVTNSGTGSAG
jgi:hypothetical protein